MIETFILNFIYLIFPLTLQTIYDMYANIYHKKISNLLSVFLFITAFYFLMRFGSPEFIGYPIILITLPLLHTYINKNMLGIILLGILTFTYYLNFGYSIIIIMMFLILIYIIYKLILNKKYFKYYFIFSFVIINLLLIIIENNSFNLLIIVIYLIIHLLSAISFILLIDNWNKMSNLHITLKEIEKEGQLKLSIFKITHEIKNPIAVCKGYLDMFDTSNIEHSEKYVPILKSEIDRTLCLLQDFLDFNKIKIEAEEMDFIMLLEEIRNSCLPLLKYNKIDYNEFIDYDDEIYINGDFYRLKQVLINIIKNSIEALKDIEDPKIVVTYKLKCDYLYLYIEDNGVGMSKEILSKIKEPFFTTKGTGTGLGITISNEIIKAHQGIIRYSSKENQGTKVEIILPLIKEK